MPTLSLPSDIYHHLKIPIKHLIQDEGHLLKRFYGTYHRAIKRLYVDKTIILTGAPFGNKWPDIFALIDLLPSEPLKTTIMEPNISITGPRFFQ